ncbi:MAG: FAD-dependent oxidoreductase [Salinivirgaceae bacterium]
MDLKTIAIIGAGPAGLEASGSLARLGHQVVLIEKSATVGGHLKDWYQLFPDRRPGKEILTQLVNGIKHPQVQLKVNSQVSEMKKEQNDFALTLTNQEVLNADAVLVTTGFDMYDSTEKEEYGYGIYDNVITNADLEQQLQKGEIRTAIGKAPKRVAIIHCVGSRDEKAGNNYCSKVCCVTAVKQAIQIKERLPETEVFCFYMDIRMFGPYYEELYREAQEKWGVVFIRGKLSEAGQNRDGSLSIKAEDTLAGKPLRMDADMLVLMAGMIPSEGSHKLASVLSIEQGQNRFFQPKDNHYQYNQSHNEGVFIAGTCVAPMNITDTIASARAVALKIDEYLKN